MLFFFFFKQKTAYEMRISDWSSDVCSSDLVQQLLAAHEHAGDVRAHVDEVVPHRLALEHLVEAARAHDLGGRDADQLRDVDPRLIGDVAVLLLGQVEEGEERKSTRMNSSH